MEIPAKLTYAWADWVASQISALGGVALTDTDIALFVSNADSKTRAAVNVLVSRGVADATGASNQYTDAQVGAAVTALTQAISQSAISAVSTAKLYTDSRANAVLTEAKQYTDQHAGTGGVSQAYVDQQDTAMLNAAKTAANSGDTTTLNAAKTFASSEADDALSLAQTYVVQQLAPYVSRETLNGILDELTNTLTATMAQADADTLAAAKLYADGKAAGVSKEYVDSEIESAKDSLSGTIESARATAVEQAATYTDSAIENSGTGFATLIDSKLAGTTTYIDEQDADILYQAKVYADNAVATGGGGGGTGEVSKTYVDTGDSNALASAKSYTDTRETAIKAAANAYADTKYALPSGGIPAATLATAVRTSLGKADTASQPSDNTAVAVSTYAAAYAADSAVKVSKNHDNYVTLESILQGSASTAVGTKVTAAMTLPAGYRPRVLSGYTCPTGAGVANVVINTNGTVDITNYIGASSYVRMDGVGFYAPAV